MITQVIDTTYQPRFTSSDLSASITERIKELAQATDEARMTEEMCAVPGDLCQVPPVQSLQCLVHPDGLPGCNQCGWLPEVENLQPLCEERRARHPHLGTHLHPGKPG